jgi:hypothetical protein
LWQQSIDDEITSCLELDVWEATDLPVEAQALPIRFVLDRKRDGDNRHVLWQVVIASKWASTSMRHLPLFAHTAPRTC